MTKILVVDDNATNRKLLVTWLGSEGYLTAEAADGADGLAAAGRQRPNLIISDILMPTMDGYEFIRRLRTEPGFAATPVIFYTANYHEHEARELAQQCGVTRVLVKPSSRIDLLAAVERALSGSDPPLPGPVGQPFDLEHLRVVTDKLSQKAEELRAANSRLSALTSLNVQLASERDPQQLLQQVCSGARNLLGASFAALAVEQKAVGRVLIQCHSGLELGTGAAPALALTSGLLAEVFRERRARRLERGNGALEVGLPAGYPAPHSVLAVPISSLSRTYGWLCLADKVGATGFSEHDEYLLTILGAQVGRVYENGALYNDVLKLNRVYAMLSGINSLLVRVGDRELLLRESCRIAVEQGGFKAAWCGLTEPLAPVAHTASAGVLPPVDELSAGPPPDLGAHPYVATAVRTKHPQICNDLTTSGLEDPLTSMLQANGCQALAALPLTVAGEAVGCLLLISTELGIFDRAEMRLLEELAGDISFSLDHIDKAERLDYLAYYDSLTGLANRTFLHERLAQHIRGLPDPNTLFAVVTIDIEDFDWLNDTLGRPSGDDVLREFAERAVRSAGDAAYVSRCGADQFALLIPRPNDIMEVTRTVESWLTQWASAPTATGQGPAIRVRAGIALFPNDGMDAAALLRSAEAALKTARLTQVPYAFYTPHLSRALQERRTLETSLRRALENHELVLYYQPKVELDSRRMVGAEALMRWQHPVRGLILPATFIPLMEETGLIIEAGLWALRQASTDRARWLAGGLAAAPRIAVNVSSVQLRREDFVHTVADALQLARADAGIDIEVTESLLMKDVTDNIEKLARIRALGVGLALDDFGTGYSSLAYLAKLPVDSIKIDRSFVVAMLDDPSAMTLVSTVISLAHTLRLKTVAEGVESEEQAKILRLLHCDQMQGFLVSHPLSFEDMATYLKGNGPQSLGPV